MKRVCLNVGWFFFSRFKVNTSFSACCPAEYVALQCFRSRASPRLPGTMVCRTLLNALPLASVRPLPVVCGAQPRPSALLRTGAFPAGAVQPACAREPCLCVFLLSRGASPPASSALLLLFS